MAFHVYILRSLTNGSFYIGHTDNLERRIWQHNNPRKKTYTAKRGPWELRYCEQFASRVEAIRRELFLKSRAGAHEKKRLAGVISP